jgi:hypothetical protein
MSAVPEFTTIDWSPTLTAILKRPGRVGRSLAQPRDHLGAAGEQEDLRPIFAPRVQVENETGLEVGSSPPAEKVLCLPYLAGLLAHETWRLCRLGRSRRFSLGALPLALPEVLQGVNLRDSCTTTIGAEVALAGFRSTHHRRVQVLTMDADQEIVYLSQPKAKL